MRTLALGLSLALGVVAGALSVSEPVFALAAAIGAVLLTWVLRPWEAEPYAYAAGSSDV